MPTLRSLLRQVPYRPLAGDLDAPVRHIRIHSGEIQPGDLFVAVRGSCNDGHDYIPEAVRRGAAAVCLQNSDRVEGGTGIAWIEVADSRTALAALAAAFHGRPDRKLDLFAVTGTNGKTTTALVLKSILEAAGRRTGLIGTIAYQIGDERIGVGLTTPDPLILHALLARMKATAVRDVVLEASSHALDQSRLYGLSFRVAAFTNLTPEHLDYHGSLEAYFTAKARLFADLGPDSSAVLNHDDPFRPRLAQICRAGRVMTYSLRIRARMFMRALVRTARRFDSRHRGDR